MAQNRPRMAYYAVHAYKKGRLPVTSVFQLVGYSHLPELGRVRVYVRAQAPLASAQDVFVQICPGRFGFDGEPLQVRRAPSSLAAQVCAHFLGQQTADGGDPFEAALPAGGLRVA